MTWPVRRRFEWDLANSVVRTHASARHPRLRAVAHAQAIWLVALLVVVLAYQGWWVTKFLQPFPFAHPFQGVVHFRISDFWQGIL